MKTSIFNSILAIGLCFSVASQLPSAAAENDVEVVEFAGTVIPAREAEITPLVDGWLNKIDFVPGQYVNEGDTLFEFNPTAQILKIRLAEARVRGAQAALDQSEAKLTRTRTLVSRNVATEADLQEAEAARDLAAVNVEQAKLTVELEQIALKHLTQKAPFTGVMGAPLVRENGWHDTSKGDITMAVITQLDPVQVVGEVPFSIYSQRRKILKTDEATLNGVVLQLVLPDGETYPHEGRPVSGGYKFDEATQKLKIWGEFANPDLLLRPGLKVTVISRLLKTDGQ